MQWQRLYKRSLSLVKFVIRRFLHDDCRSNAAPLTYTTLFAIVPMLTVLFAVLSGIPAMQSLSQAMLSSPL